MSLYISCVRARSLSGSNMEELAELNACLTRLQHHKVLLPISNNKADQLYSKHGSGLSSHLIPSLCLYTNVTWDAAKVGGEKTLALWDCSLRDCFL